MRLYEPRPTEVHSNVKALLTIFCDCSDNREFLSKGCMANKDYYLDYIRRLREAI